MWASNCGGVGGFEGYHGGGVATATQWPPGVLHNAEWWPEACAGWYYQAHSQAAVSAAQGAAAMHQASQRGTSSGHLPRFEKFAEKVSATNKQPRSSAAQPTSKPTNPTPVGLSFSELENRLNQSWEDLVSKEAQKDPVQPPTEIAMPMPSRLVTTRAGDSPLCAPPPPPQTTKETLGADKVPAKALETSDAEKVPTLSIFCPLCAEPGGTCPFHTGACWASSFSNPSSSSQQVVCDEAPPPSHIAHAMVQNLLDTEDVSTEASSADFFGSGSSDDWSDLGDVSAALLDQDGGAWYSRRESPSEELRSPGYTAGVAVAWPLPRASSLPQPQREAPRAEASSQVNREHLSQLLAMGFSEADSRTALTHVGQRGLDAAVAFLLDGVSA